MRADEGSDFLRTRFELDLLLFCRFVEHISIA